MKTFTHGSKGFMIGTFECPEVVTERPGVNGGHQREYNVVKVREDGLAFNLVLLGQPLRYASEHSIFRYNYSRSDEDVGSFWEEIPSYRTCGLRKIREER